MVGEPVLIPTLRSFLTYSISPVPPGITINDASLLDVEEPTIMSLDDGVVVPMPTLPSPLKRAVMVPLAFTMEKPLLEVLSFRVAVMSAA